MPPKRGRRSSGGPASKKKAVASKNSDKFQINDDILAFHGPLLYKARVVDISGDMYLVHYNGWNKSWDEWLDAERMMLETPDTLAYQKEIQKEVKKNGARKKKPAASKSSKGKKRKHADTVELDEEIDSSEVKVTIPTMLKKALVQDWNNIACRNLVVKLPHEVPVSQVLEDYLSQKLKKQQHNERVIREVVDGLKTYFDQGLGRTLLYRSERGQYDTITKEDSQKAPSDVYGAEHMLRLFVKLPSLLAHTQMDESQVYTLNKHLSDFLKWLQKNTSSYLNAKYIQA